MKTYQFWCPKCRKGFQENEVEKREVDTMFGEGRWWFCQTCHSSVALYANQDLDLHSIILALGDRGMNSIWQVSGVDCFGENAEELWALDDNKQSVRGNDLLRITAGIYQTIDGYFKAFDKDSISHWLEIRAWDGSGFYIETNDEKIKQLLKHRFQEVEDVEEAKHPYEGLFISVPTSAPVLSVQPSQPPVWSKPNLDPKIFAEHNRKSTSLVSAFFLIDSLEAISKCIHWLSLLKSYNMPDMNHSQYFNDVREIYESSKEAINFDCEFKLHWQNQEFQSFLRCRFFEQGKYEIELLLPGVIANEVADKFKDGMEGFCCAFMPPMFHD
jgi:hypothetical protein